jgi:hypothetical protein
LIPEPHFKKRSIIDDNFLTAQGVQLDLDHNGNVPSGTPTTACSLNFIGVFSDKEREAKAERVPPSASLSNG